MNLGFSPIVLSKSLIQNTEFSHLMVRSTIELTAEWNKKWKCFVVKEVTDDSECKNSTWHERPIKIVQCIINEKITQTSQSLIPPWRPCNGSLRPRVDILTLFLVLIGDKNKLNPALLNYTFTDLRKWDTLILGIFVYVYKLHHTHVGPIDQSSVCVVIKRYTRIIDCLFSIDINLCEIIHFLWLHGDYWVY